MNENNKDRCHALSKLALRLWGQEQQIPVVQEELAELIVAVSHANRRRDNSISNLVEEMADVQMMIEQLKIMFEVSDAELEYAIACKLDKLDKKVKRALSPNSEMK